MVQLGSVTVDDGVAACVRAAAAARGASEGYMCAYPWLASLFDPNYFTDALPLPASYLETQMAYRNPADGQLYNSGGLFLLDYGTDIGRTVSVADLVRPAAIAKVCAGVVRYGLAFAVDGGFDADGTVDSVFAIAFNSLGRFSDRRALHDAAGAAMLIAHGWNGDTNDSLSYEKAVLAAFGVSADGSVAGWPANDPTLCPGVIPPPPPLGVWCEPFPPTSADDTDQLYTAHLDRMQDLSVAF